MMPDKRPLSFVDGVGTGIAGMMLIPLLFFARSAESFAGMYRDLGGYELLPITSRVVLHPLWSWIGLASMVSLSTWVLVSRPRFRYAMVAVAVFGIVLATASYVGTYRPMWLGASHVRAF